MWTVQLMMQILYKHPGQFNMATDFQDGHHGLHYKTIIYFENNSRQSNKMIPWNWSKHVECSFKVIGTNRYC